MLSRAGVRPARDNIILEKWVPVRVSEMKANVVGAGRECGDEGTGKGGPVVHFRASSADRAACFRASIGIRTAYSVRGDGCGACNWQGDGPAAAVFRSSRTVYIR